MPKYSLEDIKRMALDFRNAKDRERPFALLTGAGCSLSAGIPLAPALVAAVKEKYFHHIGHLLLPDEHDDYGRCMGCLTTTERREILKPYLDQAKVNWAHIAIAAMMEAGFVSRVLTFNFDQVLARACGVCGLYPAIYDFGVVASSTVDHLVSPSIVHLHGQGYGQALLNTTEETEQHAAALEPVLTDTFSRFPVLIMGYSGQADSVFPKLQSIFSGRERLYWVDYAPDPNKKMISLIDKAKNTSKFLGCADADVFLIQLAQELKCWPPLLFRNYCDHLLNEVAPICNYPTELGGRDLLLNLRNSLETGRVGADLKSESTFDLLILEGKWDDVVARADEAKSSHDSNQLAWALTMQGNKLFEAALNKQDEALFAQSFKKYAEAVKIKPDMHEAFYNWGNALLELARVNFDEATFVQSFEKYSEAVRIKPDKHEAFNNWGTALSTLAHATQNEDLFRQSFSKFSEAVKIKPDKYEAYHNWGGALIRNWRLNRNSNLLDDAKKHLIQGEQLSGKPSYNLACVLAVEGDEGGCRDQLEKCKIGGTLPSSAYILADTDLEAYRDREWFKKLLE